MPSREFAVRSRDPRLDYVRAWLSRAQDSEDPFDRFFSVWISLVIATRRWEDSQRSRGEEDSDRARVERYFEAFHEQVVAALEEHSSVMRQLAARRGRCFRGSFVDTGNAELRRKLDTLSDHYLRCTSMSDQAKAVAAAGLINKIRNNLFHGLKMWDRTGDMQLLELINPVLISIVHKCALRSVE